MELKEMIKVMQYYADGGDVEYLYGNSKSVLGEANIKKDGNLSWDWSEFDYRIKEQKEKVTIEKWLLKDDNGRFFIKEGDKRYIAYHFRNKVKLLDTYEVEL